VAAQGDCRRRRLLGQAHPPGRTRRRRHRPAARPHPGSARKRSSVSGGCYPASCETGNRHFGATMYGCSCPKCASRATTSSCSARRPRSRRRSWRTVRTACPRCPVLTGSGAAHRTRTCDPRITKAADGRPFTVYRQRLGLHQPPSTCDVPRTSQIGGSTRQGRFLAEALCVGKLASSDLRYTCEAPSFGHSSSPTVVSQASANARSRLFDQAAIDAEAVVRSSFQTQPRKRPAYWWPETRETSALRRAQASKIAVQADPFVEVLTQLILVLENTGLILGFCGMQFEGHFHQSLNRACFVRTLQRD